MPVVSILAHGVSVGSPPSNNDHLREKRSTTTGWSAKATRNNTRWLQSVDHQSLDGQGYALTLTVRDSPATSDDWKAIRTNFFRRLARMGFRRLHWVVEWQRRRVPHLHCAVWFDDEDDTSPPDQSHKIVDHWMAVTANLGVSARAQHVVSIHEFGGWSKYVSKHASRGMDHYQRSAAAQPAGWTSSGRVWGHRGNWETIEPIKLEIDSTTFYQFRRIMQKLRLQDARQSNSLDRIKHAKGLLHHRCSKLGRVLGLSDWMDRSTATDVIGYLMLQGDSKQPSDPDICTCNDCIAQRYSEYFRTGSRDKRQWSSNPVSHH